MLIYLAICKSAEIVASAYFDVIFPLFIIIHTHHDLVKKKTPFIPSHVIALILVNKNRASGPNAHFTM